MNYKLNQWGQSISQYLKRNYSVSTDPRINNSSLEIPTCESVLLNFKYNELNKQRSTPSYDFSSENNKEPVVMGNNKMPVGLGLKIDISRHKVKNYNSHLNSREEPTVECSFKKKKDKREVNSETIKQMPLINEPGEILIRLPANYSKVLIGIPYLILFIILIMIYKHSCRKNISPDKKI